MNKKTERLIIRLSDSDKARLRQAAHADGRSISSFVLRAALAVSPDTTTPRRRK